jgi:hypothetical protein
MTKGATVRAANRRLPVALVSCLAGLSSRGCGFSIGGGLDGDERQAVANGLAVALPSIEATGAEFFYDLNCHAVTTADGSFSDGNPPSSCGMWADESVDAFDDGSRRTWDEVSQALDVAGAEGLHYAYFRHDADGRIVTAAFEFGCPGCEFGRVLYDAPGQPVEEFGGPDDDIRIVQLDGGWRWYEEDP